MSRKSLVPFKLLTRASDPSSGSEGEIYFNTADSSIRMHNGLVWVSITQSSSDIPFYMHTHGTDGEVNSIFPVPQSPNDLSNYGLLQVDASTPDAQPQFDFFNVEIGRAHV